MRGSLVVALTALLLFLAVVAVHGFDPDTTPQDEILAYQVSPDQNVEVTLHGGVDRVTLTTWLLVPLDTPADTALPYALDVRVSDSDGEAQISRRFETYSRLPATGADALTYEARVADALALVTEPRTIDVDVRPLAGKAGRLRVQTAPGKYANALLRLAHRVERSDFEKNLLARTLGAAKRQRLIADRSSLGFFDIPDAVRADALGHWQRRLTAAGREGRDYVVRRLLIGRRPLANAEVVWSGREFDLGPARRLALNLRGRVHLRVHAATTTEIHVEWTGGELPSAHSVEAGRSVELELGEEGIGTVLLHANPPARVALSAPVSDGPALVAREPPRQLGRRLELVPDVVRQPVYRLDRTHPVTVSVAGRQARVGVSVRSSELDSMVSAVHGSLTAVWRDARGEELERVPLAFALEPSLFETIDDGPSSHRKLAHLHVPTGAASVDLLGPERLSVSPFVPEPGASEVALAEPYDAIPPEGFRWRNARLAEKDWAPVRPDNLASLRADGRVSWLRAQVRLERLAPPRSAVAPRTLAPRGRLVRHPLFSPAVYDPVQAFPSNGWLLLDRGRAGGDVVIPGSGQLGVLFHAPADRLGHVWEVSGRDQTLFRSTLNFQTGRLDLEAPPGRMAIRYQGLGERGLLLLKAPPLRPKPILKRQSVYALDGGQSLEFSFHRGPRELLSVVVVVVVAGGPRPIVIEHAVDGGRVSGRANHFYRRTTAYESRHAVEPGEFGPALLWKTPMTRGESALGDALTRVIVPLGDDLAPGHHRLRVHNPASPGDQGRNRYWIRAVLVGSVLPEPSDP